MSKYDGTGEKPHIRNAMDRFAKQLRESGASPSEARAKAVKHANRVHNIQTGRGNPSKKTRD